MKDTEIERKDSESILIALEQISQTIAVMTNVVEKLREQYIEKENSNNAKTSMENSNYSLEEATNQTIH
tara:strand:- start:213 stop:419 length:207 start_codon:yes stop_codon:yes gene_type:complete